MSTRVLTAHIPKTLAREVDKLSERLDRPKGWIMKKALERFVDLERKRYELTLEGLADGDARRTVDHAEVVAWAAGLKGARKSKTR